MNVYHCDEPTCTLGARGETGRFTGGITPEGLNRLKGTPVEACTPENEGELWGEGVCPNCGEATSPAGDEYAVHEPLPPGDDPLQHLHDLAAAEDLAARVRAADTGDAFTDADLAAHRAQAQQTLIGRAVEQGLVEAGRSK